MAATGAAMTGITTGCLGDGAGTSGTYVFGVRSEATGVDSLVAQFLDPPLVAQEADLTLGYDERYRRQLVDRLLETGTVETRELAYTIQRAFGTETKSAPRFTQHDGTYYRISITDREETPTERRALYVEPIDESPPSSASVTTIPVDGLSDRDRRAVETALNSVSPPGREPLDTDDLGFPYRGVVFHHQIDEGDTDLLPEPPFEYLERDGDYFRVAVSRGTVEMVDYSFRARPVAESRSALEQYTAEEVAVASLDAGDLSGGARDVLRTAIEDAHYRESLPRSSGLEELFSALGMLDAFPGDPTTAVFEDVLFEFDGTWYSADLTVR